MTPARRLARGLCAGLLAGVAALGGHAAAQDKPRPRPKPLPQPSDSAASNSLSDAAGPGGTGQAPTPAKPGTPSLRPLLPTPPPLVLRSAVQSRYSRPSTIARSTAGQCRAQCAVARTQCAEGGDSDTSGCDPGWTQCLSACGRLNYARGP